MKLLLALFITVFLFMAGSLWFLLYSALEAPGFGR